MKKKAFYFGLFFVFIISSCGSNSSLFKATRANDVEKANLAIKEGADVNAINASETPLHVAASLGNVEISMFLIENGANVNAVDNNGRTPLHYAVMANYEGSEDNKLSIIKLLFENGANIEANEVGYTPLLFAVMSKSSDAALYLIEEGANINAKDLIGTSVLNYAIMVQLTKVVEKLQSLEAENTGPVIR